jgi:hypothetical protein
MTIKKETTRRLSITPFLRKSDVNCDQPVQYKTLENADLRQMRAECGDLEQDSISNKKGFVQNVKRHFRREEMSNNHAPRQRPATGPNREHAIQMERRRKNVQQDE